MIREFTSPPDSARVRGRNFGEIHRAEIVRTVGIYRELFNEAAGSSLDTHGLGLEALDAISEFSPALADEIEGIAEGAGLDVATVAALNARTEIFAWIDAAYRGECSTIVALRHSGQSPIAVQTWDWHSELADCWFIWTIESTDGRAFSTLTEYGIVGKIGVNSSGIGVHLNILHHRDDGGPMGVPVHVVARSVLESARNMTQALMESAQPKHPRHPLSQLSQLKDLNRLQFQPK